MKQKITIMEQRPQLSDEEIRSHMDFDRLLADRKLALSKPKFHLLKWIVPAIAVLGVTTWLIVDRIDGNKKEESVNIDEPQVASNFLTDSNASITTEDTHPVPPKEESGFTKLPEKKSTSAQQKPETREKVEAPDDQIYIQAEPLDGYPALYDYLNSNLVYPKEAINDSIQGVETVSFTINIEGKPENITIKQSLGAPFEKEARRLIENMPLWKPATVDGTPVASKMSIPLTFNIQKVKATR